MVAHALPVEAAPLIFEPGAYKGRQLSGARVVTPLPLQPGEIVPPRARPLLWHAPKALWGLENLNELISLHFYTEPQVALILIVLLFYYSRQNCFSHKYEWTGG